MLKENVIYGGIPMKKWIGSVCFLYLLTACNTTPEQNQRTGWSTEPMNYNNMAADEYDFNFKNFLLEVEYEDEITYQIRYEESQMNQNAAIHDTNGQQITGEEALNQLTPLLHQLNLTPSMSDEEAARQLTEVLELNPNFEELELDIAFADGQMKEFEWEKEASESF
jgi:hypothetical protein